MRRLPPIVIGFFVILILVLLWNGWAAIRERQRDRQIITETPTREDLLRPEEGQHLVSDESTIEPTVLADGRTVIALAGDGNRFTKVSLETGEATVLSSELVGDRIGFVRYAPDGGSAIVHRREDLDGPGSTTLYRFPDGGTAELSAQIFDLVYLPDSQTIVYLYQVGDGTFTLARAKPDGTEWRMIRSSIRLPAPRLALAPDGARILVAPDPTAEGDELATTAPDRTPLLVFLESETSEPMPVLTGGADFAWSPDGTSLAYHRSTEDPNAGALTIYDMTSGQETITSTLTGTRLFTWHDATHLVVAPLTVSVTGVRIGEHPLRVDVDGETIELPAITIGSGVHELHVASQANVILLLIRGALISVPLP